MVHPRSPLAEYLANLAAHPGDTQPVDVVRTLGQHVQDFREHADLAEEDSTLLAQVADVLQRIVREHGETKETLVFEMMTLGKLGRFGEAIGRARSAFEKTPSWATAIAAGNALRRAGQMPAAAEMFAAAAKLDLKDVTALLEVGDIELDQGRVAEALSAYEAALERKRSQPWAQPSAWYCRYLLTQKASWLEKLRQAASQPEDACGVEGMLSQFLGGYSGEDRRARAKSLLDRLERAP